MPWITLVAQRLAWYPPGMGNDEKDARVPRVVEITEEHLLGIVRRGVSGELPKGDEVSAAELAGLPLPPFPGANAKRFRRLPHWPRAGSYMLWAEGQGELEQVVAFYLAAVQRDDPGALAEPRGRWMAIRSQKAGADINICLYEDGTTVSAQITFGAT